MLIEYVLLLGSNLGKKQEQIIAAAEKIEGRSGRIVKRSSMRESKAWGKTDQDDFLNCCIVVDSVLEPHQMLKTIQQIEREAGRQRYEKWGARTLDIDILYIDDQVLNTPDLIIPHPFIAERAFTLVLLNEILPDKIHPLLRLTNRQLFERIKSE